MQRTCGDLFLPCPLSHHRPRPSADTRTGVEDHGPAAEGALPVGAKRSGPPDRGPQSAAQGSHLLHIAVGAAYVLASGCWATVEGFGVVQPTSPLAQNDRHVGTRPKADPCAEKVAAAPGTRVSRYQTGRHLHWVPPVSNVAEARFWVVQPSLTEWPSWQPQVGPRRPQRSSARFPELITDDGRRTLWAGELRRRIARDELHRKVVVDAEHDSVRGPRWRVGHPLRTADVPAEGRSRRLTGACSPGLRLTAVILRRRSALGRAGAARPTRRWTDVGSALPGWPVPARPSVRLPPCRPPAP